MSKGISLPVEYLIIIIIAVVVLLAVVAFFTGGLNWLFPLNTQAELGKACQVIRNNQCSLFIFEQDTIVPTADPRDDDDINCQNAGICYNDDKVTVSEICYIAGAYKPDDPVSPWAPCLKACFCSLPTP